jgi:hypothetical protein
MWEKRVATPPDPFQYMGSLSRGSRKLLDLSGPISRKAVRWERLDEVNLSTAFRDEMPKMTFQSISTRIRRPNHTE